MGGLKHEFNKFYQVFVFSQLWSNFLQRDPAVPNRLPLHKTDYDSLCNNVVSVLHKNVCISTHFIEYIENILKYAIFVNAIFMYAIKILSMPFLSMRFSRMPFSRMPFSRMPFSRMPFSRMPFSRMPFSHMPFSHMPFFYLVYAIFLPSIWHFYVVCGIST